MRSTGSPARSTGWSTGSPPSSAGAVAAVIATGGLAPIVVAESRTITHHEPDLTLIGLDLVYAKNVTPEKARPDRCPT